MITKLPEEIKEKLYLINEKTNELTKLIDDACDLTGKYFNNEKDTNIIINNVLEFGDDCLGNDAYANFDEQMAEFEKEFLALLNNEETMENNE
jgi:hypothetical protein